MFLITFKNRLFPIKNVDKISSSEPTPEPETEPTKHNRSKLRLPKELLNEVIAIKKDINDEIFWKYFKY